MLVGKEHFQYCSIDIVIIMEVDWNKIYIQQNANKVPTVITIYLWVTTTQEAGEL